MKKKILFLFLFIPLINMTAREIKSSKKFGSYRDQNLISRLKIQTFDAKKTLYDFRTLFYYGVLNF